MQSPVCTEFTNPTERVIFHSERDANPFFHLFESFWMLCGRNDVAYLKELNSRMSYFSDDGVTFHGAYGYRWKEHFGTDQLETAINLLRNHPDTRRCVVTMWDPECDLHETEGGYKDLPCNTQLYFRVSAEKRLTLTILNRSNDAIWGAYGANAVHFSVLQEYVAAITGFTIGPMYTFTNNLHAYKETYSKVSQLADRARDPYRTVYECPYSAGIVKPHRLVNSPSNIQSEIQDFVGGRLEGSYQNKFFNLVAVPMRLAYNAWKHGTGERRYKEALHHIAQMPEDNDWRVASKEWLERRYKKWLDKNDQG